MPLICTVHDMDMCAHAARVIVYAYAQMLLNRYTRNRRTRARARNPGHNHVHATRACAMWSNTHGARANAQRPTRLAIHWSDGSQLPAHARTIRNLEPTWLP